ncbi:MAG: helix-turn-helix domain-containing protein [Chloroflexota bacterium]|nr:helix-turn-helix domain-containing protein [Chloroflexota bacterium]
MTVVEEVQEVSAAHAQAPVASSIRTRRSRRPSLSLEEKQEIARLYADSSTSTSEICARLGIGESSLYRILQLQGVPLRGRTAPSVSAGTTPQPAPAQSGTRKSFVERWTQPQIENSVSGGAVQERAIASEVPQTPEATVAPVVGGAKSITRRRRTAAAGRRTRVEAPIETPSAIPASAPTRTRRARTAGVSRSSDLLQFTVSFVAEQTLQAASALDALQQAEARGATEVTSIVRIA